VGKVKQSGQPQEIKYSQQKSPRHGSQDRSEVAANILLRWEEANRDTPGNTGQTQLPY